KKSEYRPHSGHDWRLAKALEFRPGHSLQPLPPPFAKGIRRKEQVKLWIASNFGVAAEKVSKLGVVAAHVSFISAQSRVSCNDRGELRAQPRFAEPGGRRTRKSAAGRHGSPHPPLQLP